MVSDDEFNTWVNRLRGQSKLDRWEAAESPPDVEPERVVPFLVEALNDSHELVRLCAAEALGNYPGTQTREALKLFIDREPDDNAKGYGLTSLGLVADHDDLAFIMRESEGGNSANLMISSVLALCCAARRIAKHRLLSFLQHESATIRAAAANGLTWVYSSADEDAIETLRRRIQLEPARGIKIDMQKALAELLGNKADELPSSATKLEAGDFESDQPIDQG